MKISQAEYFLEVAKYLNFTTAAKSLYISQPALSKQIALLEDEIGTKLLVRNSRNVSLTAAGKQFYMDINDIMSQIERAKKRAAKIGEDDCPIFRVGCFDGLYTADFLPDFYEYVQMVDPKMQIRLSRGSFTKNKQDLERGDIDVLITLNSEWDEDNGYCTRLLKERAGALIYSENFLAAQVEHPQPSDFDGKNLVLMDSKSECKMHDIILEEVKKLGIQNIQQLESDNMATLSAYVEMGKGYSLLAENTVKSNPILRKANFNVSPMKVIAVWKKDNVAAEIIMEVKN